MNKIFASVGAVALGAISLQAAGVESVDPAKPWSVSLTLRGFYDSNYVTAPDDAKRDSFGIEIDPSAAVSIATDQTTLGARYTLGARWYQDRNDLSSTVSNDPWEYSHEFEAFLNHQFSERYTLDLRDDLVISQEPQLWLDPATTYRTEGNDLRNRAQANFTAALTPTIGVVLGYQNTLVNYEDSGGNALNPSLSGLLDRMEQLGLINLRWQARPDSFLVLGYNYGVVDYTGDEPIADINGLAPGGIVNSDYRNNDSHYGYLGLDHNVSKELQLSLRGGVQAVDYNNDPTADTDLSPYGQISLAYKYRPDSTVTVGWTYSHSATDIVSPDTSTGQITEDQDSSVLFASINHQITALLSGYVRGFWQASQFNGGLYDGDSDNFYSVGLGLQYRFSRHLSGDIGYSYDTLNSDLPNRDYDRNRVWLGVTAVY